MNSKFRTFQKNIWYKISPIMYNISPVIATKLLFMFSMKQRLNLNNPKTFNEKIQWLKLYWKDERVARCGDKYDVRAYVEECGLGEILNPIFGVYRRVEDIDFRSLPKKFALKGTHGCGYNIICKDKDKLDIDNVKKTCDLWLNSRYAYISAEVQYDKMEPKLIVEKFLEGKEGKVPTDYKVFCFNGEPKVTMVCEGRSENQRSKYYFYDNLWNIMPYNADSKELISQGKNRHEDMPKSFPQMLEYAKVLSRPFPFVRVDFYDIEERPILGEMTFTPCGGIDSRLDKEVDKIMGSYINLPNEKIL